MNRVKTLVNGYLAPGSYSLTWDGKDNSGSNVSSIDVNGYFTSDYDRYVVYLEGLYSANDSIDVYRMDILPNE